MLRCLRAGLLLCLTGAALWAVDWKALRPEGYVSDFARVVDPAARQRLEAYCASVERSTGAQMALVTLPSLQGEPIEDVANSIFRDWGVGRQGRNDGVMLLLSIGDRRSRLEVGSGLERVLPDNIASGVLAEMGPALRAQRYGEALIAAAQTVGDDIARAKNVTAPERLRRAVRPTVLNSIPWPLIIGGAMLALWLLRMRAGGGPGYGVTGGGFLTGLVAGEALARSTWGARGSGGFGGFDSSDGFGGFGGGDSGGGGASSDW